LCRKSGSVRKAFKYVKSGWDPKSRYKVSACRRMTDFQRGLERYEKLKCQYRDYITDRDLDLVCYVIASNGPFKEDSALVHNMVHIWAMFRIGHGGKPSDVLDLSEYIDLSAALLVERRQ
jgi:hypothetical protein